MKQIAKTHPIILILEELGADKKHKWAFEYRGDSYIVQTPFVKLYNKDKQGYDSELLQNILAEHYRGNEVRGITVFSKEMEQQEKLRLLKEKQDKLTQAINKLELNITGGEVK